MIGWENNRDGDITMLLSVKTIGSAGYRDQWNKSFGTVLVNRKPSASNSYLGENARVIFLNSLSASGFYWKLFQTFLGQNGSENIVSVTNKACKTQKASRFHNRTKLSWEWIARKTAVEVQPARERARLSPCPSHSCDISRLAQNRELSRRLVEISMFSFLGKFSACL